MWRKPNKIVNLHNILKHKYIVGCSLNSWKNEAYSEIPLDIIFLLFSFFFFMENI